MKSKGYEDWGKELAEMYSDELESNTEDELWVNQRFTGLEAPIDTELDSKIELSEWGKELASIYTQNL